MVERKIKNPSPISIDGKRRVTPEMQWTILSDESQKFSYIPFFNCFVKEVHYGFIKERFKVWYGNSEGKLITCNNEKIIDLLQQHCYKKSELDIIPYKPGIILFYTNTQIFATLDMGQCIEITNITREGRKGNLLNFIQCYGNIKKISREYDKFEFDIQNGQIHFEKATFNLYVHCNFSNYAVPIYLNIFEPKNRPYSPNYYGIDW